VTKKKRFWHRFKSEPAKPTKNVKKAGDWTQKVVDYVKWLLNDKD